MSHHAGSYNKVREDHTIKLRLNFNSDSIESLLKFKHNSIDWYSQNESIRKMIMLQYFGEYCSIGDH